MTWNSTPNPVLTDHLMAHQHAEDLGEERAAALEDLVVEAIPPEFFRRFRKRVVKPALTYGACAFGLLSGAAWASADEALVPFTPSVVSSGAVAGAKVAAFSLDDIDYVVPAASVTGVGGSEWSTNLKALCFSPESCTYTLYAMRNGQTTPEPAMLERSLAAGLSEHRLNVLQDLGLSDFSGVLLLDVQEGAVAFDTRTLNKIDGSEVGLRVQPLSRDDAIPVGEEGFVFVTPDVENYRVNTWLFAWEPATLTYSIQSTSGTTLAQDTRTLAAGQTLQLNGLLDRYNILPGDDPIGIVLTTTGLVNVTNSVIDNRDAQDPTAFPASFSPVYRIDMVASDQAGANDSQWKTAVMLWNPHTQAKNVVYDYYYTKDGENRIATSNTTVPGRGGKFFPHILDSYWLRNTTGTLRVTPCNGGHVAGRIYSETPSGSTSGQGTPPLTRLDALSVYHTGFLFGLEQHADARTNIGVFNPLDANVSVGTATVKDGTTGHVFGRKQFSLEPKEQLQFNTLLEQYGYTGTNGLVEVRAFIGTLHAYAATIAEEPGLEIPHNDPTYQPAKVAMPPFPTLDMVVFGPTETNPFTPITLDVYATELRRVGDIISLTIDANGDGDLDDPIDIIHTTNPHEIFIEQFTLDYDGKYSGATVPIGITVNSTYNNHYTDSRTTTHMLQVGKISEMGQDWQTREDASDAVNARIVAEMDDFVNKLSDGGNVGTPAQVRQFLEATTSCSDIIYHLNDTSNDFSAFGCGSQGSLGNSYESSFNYVLERLAPWVEPNEK